ncbi:MAG TPA: DUF3025 domain-containing protein [Rhodanobacteraceae bacterium]|nr:DUF3025 domain-containing protein [Rhodanobacteraceae bacterium]
MLSGEHEAPAGDGSLPLFRLAFHRDRIFETADFEALNDALRRREDTRDFRFVVQDAALLSDGLHYEERIARRGIIATRQANTHDLFNAHIWLRHAGLKRAMNARQVADIARVGQKRRTRGQCALTHFDEAGAIVWLASRDLVRTWDAHEWRVLFRERASDWGARIAVTVIGHALFDHVLAHGEAPVAKAIAVVVDETAIATRACGAVLPSWPDAERSIADSIEEGRLLADPQELRPLPLAGIPGWHASEQDDRFYATSPCFRPLRKDRSYPAPIVWSPADR